MAEGHSVNLSSDIENVTSQDGFILTLLKIIGNLLLLTPRVPTRFTFLSETGLCLKIEALLLLQNVVTDKKKHIIVKSMHSSLHSESNILPI
ncbi:Spondin domain-containing protein [Aphis craccivora]|uniref:Spondin domain-containing protein n=1 Tax=Aphis craccivora TaxID=307492 RepID=A0A6G0Y165_APHCR|nr:Spondin domain-containing protein [Aphis craccivora]